MQTFDISKQFIPEGLKALYIINGNLPDERYCDIPTRIIISTSSHYTGRGCVALAASI